MSSNCLELSSNYDKASIQTKSNISKTHTIINSDIVCVLPDYFENEILLQCRIALSL